MQKIFLSAIMLAGAYALCAQEVTVYKATDVNYQVPVIIKTNFQAAYPAATQVTWQPMSSDWWYATYKDNNRLTIVYYNTQPYYLIRDESYKMSLPVLNTFVPEDVIANAVNTYGGDLYSITAMKVNGAETPTYQVVLIKNGTMESATMNGTAVASANNL
jgi:hypothetical protein